MSSVLDADLAEMLATVTSAIKDTLRDRPGQTIVPRPKRETSSERALELLRDLASHTGTKDPGASLVLGQEIARGGMGRIRVANQVALGREVAVKTLREELASDRGAVLELLREAWLTGALEHPNVMPVYNIAVDVDGSPLIVLKRVEGVTWAELMTDAETVAERFGATDLLEWNLEILLRVLDALRFAHNRAIIHRDVKPDNVMVGEFGEVYLVDWGIAVCLEADPSGRLPHVSQTVGVVAGTPCYMAPEMLGEAQDRRTDVYLAGAVLYEIVTGRPPHLGASVLEVLSNVATSDPIIPTQTIDELAAICRSALARRVEDRFESVEAMRAALQSFLNHRGSSKLSDRAAESLAALREVLAEESDGPTEKRERVYRLLGECRFGFGAALSAWAENPAAIEGRRDALSYVAQFELDNGDPGAADSLLSNVINAPVDLRESISSALLERARARKHYAALAGDADLRLGNRTRTFLTLVLGTLWVGTSLAVYFIDQRTHISTAPGSYGRMILMSLGLLLFVIGLAVWARDSVLGSRVNRLLAVTVSVGLSCQTLLLAGFWIIGADPVLSQVLLPLIWAVGAISVTILEIPLAFPLTIGYVAAFFLSALFPGQRFLFIAAANFVVMVNALLIWARFAKHSVTQTPD